MEFELEVFPPGSLPKLFIGLWIADSYKELSYSMHSYTAELASVITKVTGIAIKSQTV